VAKKPTTRRVRRNIARGIAFIKATFNNTMITITDPNGDTLCWASAGSVHFKGHAEEHAVRGPAGSRGLRSGRQEVRHCRGGGQGHGARFGARVGHHRPADGGIRILSIEDVTPLPHNGCRPAKRRRV